MNSKVAINIRGLNPRDTLTKFKKGSAMAQAAPAVPSPNPSFLIIDAGNKAIEDNLDATNTAEGLIVTLRNARVGLLETGLVNYTALGGAVQSFSLGNPDVITAKGFDVAASGTPLPPVGRIQNVVLTHGDHDGDVDVSWNRDKSSQSNQVFVSPDPITPTSFVQHQITSKSSCTIHGQPIGGKIWVQVCGNDSNGPGDMSEMAHITVS